MADDYLFGSPKRLPGKRYHDGTQEDKVPWPPDEELLLWPVLYNCRSELAYKDACKGLMTHLDRLPDVADGDHQTPDRWTKNVVKKLQMRTETRHLSSHSSVRPVIELAHAVFRARRSGPVRMWGEAEILRQYRGKAECDSSPMKQRGPFSDVLTFLDREAGDPDATAFVYENRCKATIADGPSPFDRDRKDRTLELVVAWTRTRGRPVHERLPAWEALCRYCSGG